MEVVAECDEFNASIGPPLLENLTESKQGCPGWLAAPPNFALIERNAARRFFRCGGPRQGE